ncbi:MAG TPA: hypothetical protein VKB34_14530 [Povalibacter sp.]|nr:hypothetical protein [Povalibacter sp.]
MTRCPILAGLVFVVGSCPVARAEPVIGQFELKTLDCEPGAYEFQSQNAWSWGQPDRQIDSDDSGGFIVDENAVIGERYALELERGFTHFFKVRVGIEAERERVDEPLTPEQANDFDDLKIADVGVELVAVLVPRHGDGAGLGLVTEIEGPIDQHEPNNLTLGPIVEFRSGHWFAAAVPMAVHAFGGKSEAGNEVDDKWDFAYAAQLMYVFEPRWSLAVEGYGTVERIGTTGNPSDSAQHFGDFDQHRIGAVLYYTHDSGGVVHREPQAAAADLSDSPEDEGRSFTVGLGLLEGLNGNTPDHTLKLSIEVHF